MSFRIFLFFFVLGLAWSGTSEFAHVDARVFEQAKEKLALEQSFELSSTHSPSRDTASTTTSLNDWESLPCPSEEEYLNLATTLKLANGKSVPPCDLSPEGKLRRAFGLIEKLKAPSLPAGWGGVHRPFLLQPLKELSRLTDVLDLDLKQQNSIAYNFLQGRIFLGGQFFQSDPLFAVSVLIHEARHSDPQDPAHARCLWGNIPKSRGGCDEILSLAPTAGAYSTSVFYELGLAQFADLSEGDQLYLKDLALGIVSTRFNQWPAFLAMPVEGLYLLSESGRLYGVHPLTAELIPQELPPEWLPLRRIELNIRDGNLFLYTSQDQVFTWPNPKQERFEPDLISKKLQVVDVNKIFIAARDRAQTAFLTRDRRLQYFDYSAETGLLELHNDKPPFSFDPVQILIGNNWTNFLLSQEGQVHQMIQGSRNRSAAATELYGSFNQSGQPQWRQIHGGVFHDRLFALSREGDLVVEANAKGDLRPPFEDSAQAWPRGLRKFLEGASARMALLESGELLLESHNGQERKLLNWVDSGERWIDFAMTRRAWMPAEVVRPTGLPSDFTERCKVLDGFIEPWLNRPLGLNRAGQLVDLDRENKCRRLTPPRKIFQSLSLEAQDRDKQNRDLPLTSLVLRDEQGRAQRFRPYFDLLAPSSP